jgi:thiamine-phosphate pyrophosphorylase
MSAGTRTIDANINRVSEGLRVLDDIARFTLNDAPLSKGLKEIRHAIVSNADKLGISLISSRDVSSDWGSSSREKASRSDLASLISANARRAEEGIRVIEELAKLPEFSKSLSSADFKKARFAVYQIERDLVSRITRKSAASGITGLYVVIDISLAGNKDPLKLASEAIAGGARIIQIRHKYGDKKEIFDNSVKLQKLCASSGVMFIVNDHVDVAMACNADGVHLGQSDLPVAAARKLLPLDKLIGCSAGTVVSARKAQRDGADYVGVGSIFPTSSKDISVVGLERLRKIKDSLTVPVVAIGGINEKNISGVVKAGADSAAVISAVLSAPDPRKAASKLAGAFLEKNTRASK